jgi:PPK2 family polyphosphate:nucleotide phosphotransferase
MKPKAPRTPYLVPYDGSFRIAKARTAPAKGELAGDEAKDVLKEVVERIEKRQRQLMADARHAVLLVFQAMDAAGKDGTIRALTMGLNGAGVHVVSFREPSSDELAHDYLWRIARNLPAQGRVGIFNRSHYEEVVAVRVHPEYLASQRLPGVDEDVGEKFWTHRLASMRHFEHHLARNGTVVRKFFLNVSKDEQRRRFLDRIDQEDSHWKFSPADLEKRARWDDYMGAYEKALRATSRPWAPWYAIPADDKPHMRLAVASIVLETLESLGLEWPKVGRKELAQMRILRAKLAAER